MKGLRHIRSVAGTAWGSSAMPPLAEVKLSEAQVAQIVDMIAQVPSEVSEHLVRNAVAVFGACAQPAQPAQQAGRDGARRAQGQAPRTLLTQHRWVLLPLCRVSPASVVSHSSFLGFSRLGAYMGLLCACASFHVCLRLVELLSRLFRPRTQNITTNCLDLLAWDLKCMLQPLSFLQLVAIVRVP